MVRIISGATFPVHLPSQLGRNHAEKADRGQSCFGARAQAGGGLNVRAGFGPQYLRFLLPGMWGMICLQIQSLDFWFAVP